MNVSERLGQLPFGKRGGQYREFVARYTVGGNHAHVAESRLQTGKQGLRLIGLETEQRAATVFVVGKNSVVIARFPAKRFAVAKVLCGIIDSEGNNLYETGKRDYLATL